jgi:TPR repeat protein
MSVASDVPVADFAEFVKDVQNEPVPVTAAKIDSLSLLAKESSFDGLSTRCDSAKASLSHADPSTDTTFSARLAFVEQAQLTAERNLESLSASIDGVRRRLTGELRSLRDIVEGFQDRIAAVVMSTIRQEIEKVTGGTTPAELLKRVEDFDRLLKSDLLYRRGCDFIYGQNGYESVKSQTLGLSHLQTAANMGHADAQYVLGQCRRDGLGCDKNLKEFAKYTRMAAEQGHSYGEARYSYALVYGFGVTRDEDKAFEYAKKSAERGNAVGQNQLAYSYEAGIGVATNPVIALQFYKMSADQGNSYGQMNYGLALWEGRCVDQDISAAVEYFKLAAEQGNSYGQALYGQALLEGKGVMKDFSRGARWVKKAADQGSAEGQYQYAWCLENGKGTNKEIRKAIEFYRMAAEQGNPNGKSAYERLRRRAWA